MKSLWIPLVAVIVLVAASTASAGWMYTPTSGWTYSAPVYSAPVYSAPTVYYHAPAPPVYVYRPPVYRVPMVVAPAPVIRTYPTVVRSRVIGPRRALRRTVWRVW